MPSRYYNSLRSNILLLRKHLLPSKFNELGDYRERVFTGVVAFKVLSHAAIEEYFEERAIEIARNAHIACRDRGKISWPATCLVAFCGTEMRTPPETLDAPQPSRRGTWAQEIDVREKIGLAASNYISRIKRENHGILEKNILSILLPIGISHSSIDRLFLSEIDSFGRSRGEYAHTSVAKHVTSRPNPKNEYDRVDQLVKMILQIDIELDALLKDVV